jgi:hypothetical protein
MLRKLQKKHSQWSHNPSLTIRTVACEKSFQSFQSIALEALPIAYLIKSRLRQYKNHDTYPENTKKSCTLCLLGAKTTGVY